jgi:hypothetical protein
MALRHARLHFIALALLSATALPALAADVSVNAAGVTLVNHGLVGFGRIPASTKDKFGESFGSGSAMAVDTTKWTRGADGAYGGTVYLLPDRGYNVEGTTDYQGRLNALSLTLKPVAAGGTDPDQKSIDARLVDSLMFTDDKGQPFSGLDPIDGTRAAADGLPELPQATNGKLVIDAEGLAMQPDGSFLVSDEYGPDIFRFDATGKLLSATLPPEALLPVRKGAHNYSANAPTTGAPKPDPENPETGRQNNQGLEGLSITPDGKYLIAVLQSATRQDGGDKASTRDKTRALVYDLTDPASLKLVHEYVVPLPTFKSGDKTLVAAQSEIVAISDTAWLMLARDSGNGQGLKGDTSLYRKIVVVDAAKATDIANGPFDAPDKPVAAGGKLDASVTPVSVTEFIDLNDNAELNRFGMHNGAPNDKANLSEKWEGMSLASLKDSAAPDDYFLFVVNDNDFLTQDGFQVGAAYKVADGADVDTMIQAYRVTIPGLN